MLWRPTPRSSPHESSVQPHVNRQPATGQSHRDCAHVRVLGGGRPRDRLAHDPSGAPGAVGRRVAVHGSHRGGARWPHLTGRSRPVVGRNRSGAGPGGGGSAPVFAHQAWHPARPRWPQGIQRRPLEWRPTGAGQRRRLAGLGAVGRAAQRARARASCAGRRGPCARARCLRRQRSACPASGLRRHRTARRARLSAAPVPVAAVEPARRRLWRFAGKPHAFPAGSVPGLA
ncbi:hypothetical protein D3C85_384960 [compost metagenome]